MSYDIIQNIMLELRDYGYNYQVIFKGPKEKYSDYFVAMNKLSGSKLVGKPGWKVAKEYLPELATFFEVEHVANPWDNIGEGLKLEPYCYQKETIQFATENNKALLILPCGAGKTPILVGIYHELRKNNITTKPGAIIVKASLKYQWVKEVQKFSDYRVNAIDTPSKAKKKFDEQFENADLFILNYETLKNDKVVEKLREKEVEVMLFD